MSFQKVLLQGLGLLLSVNFSLQAQQSTTITLQNCYQKVETNYPLVKQYNLLQIAQQYNIDNLAKGYLPQIQLAAQASYQSDVTRIPNVFPNVQIDPLSKDQYKVYAEVIQPISDLFAVGAKQDLVKYNVEIEKTKIDVALHQVKEKVNQLYFGVLLIEHQIQQVEILKKDIQAAQKQLTVAVQNGVALKTTADVLQAELLKAQQRSIELKSARLSYLQILGALMSETLDENTNLQTPEMPILTKANNRPERSLFDAQIMLQEEETRLLKYNLYPKLYFFAQGGYGRPHLNLLDNNFDFYYIAGLRFSWNISNFYTNKTDRKIKEVTTSIIKNQKEVFELTINQGLIQINNDIAKLEALIETDKEIIAIRETAKNTAETQLSNGAITVNDFIKFLDAVDMARQNLAIHQTQLLMSQYNYLLTTGNN